MSIPPREARTGLRPSEEAEKAFSGRDADYEIYVTKCAGDAVTELRRRGESGEEYRIYACGGDGTFNECVRGAAGFGNLAVCPFPTGTGNDFCRMFGDERDLFKNLPALIDGEIHPIDLIRINDSYSANICSVGFDARVGTNVHKYSSIPVIGGAGGYVISTIVEAFKGVSSRMHVVTDGYDRDEKHALVCACNGRYYGGGFNPSLDAMPDDGKLDIYIAKGVGLLRLAANIGKYASGRSDEAPGMITHIVSDHVTIEFEEESVINVDGEALTAKKAEMRLVPRALNLIVPRGMTFFG